MNKAELIDAVSNTAKVAKGDAERTLSAFFDQVLTSARRGDRIAWPGFGSFSTTRRKARTGRNPQTGASVMIPASTAMKFTASATLKTNLNSKKAAVKAPAAKKTGTGKAAGSATKATGSAKKAASSAKRASSSAAKAAAPAKKAAGTAKRTIAKKSAR